MYHFVQRSYTPLNSAIPARSLVSALQPFLAVAAAVALYAPCALPQTPLAVRTQTPATSAPEPAFEVASVKESPPNHGYTYTGPWGSDGFTVRNASLNYLIEIAYGVQWNLIAGQPGWFDSAYYDISARTEGGVKLDYIQVRAPLSHLLEERFHLETHWVQKDVNGFALVVAKGRPKLQLSKEDDKPYGYIVANGLEAQNMNMGTLAAMLVSPAGRPIVDRTGIKGTFKFKLSYATANNPDSNLPDLFTALQEQLGLKLETQKVPVEMLVIDHVDRIPTEN
jgi:uncharacterized protein (TIGR03435 family)